MNNSIVFAIGPRLFIPAEKKIPGVWLEWFICPNNPPTFSGTWIIDDFGFLVEV